MNTPQVPRPGLPPASWAGMRSSSALWALCWLGDGDRATAGSDEQRHPHTGASLAQNACRLARVAPGRAEPCDPTADVPQLSTE